MFVHTYLFPCFYKNVYMHTQECVALLSCSVFSKEVKKRVKLSIWMVVTNALRSVQEFLFVLMLLLSWCQVYNGHYTAICNRPDDKSICSHGKARLNRKWIYYERYVAVINLMLITILFYEWTVPSILHGYKSNPDKMNLLIKFFFYINNILPFPKAFFDCLILQMKKNPNPLICFNWA